MEEINLVFGKVRHFGKTLESDINMSDMTLLTFVFNRNQIPRNSNEPFPRNFPSDKKMERRRLEMYLSEQLFSPTLNFITHRPEVAEYLY